MTSKMRVVSASLCIQLILYTKSYATTSENQIHLIFSDNAMHQNKNHELKTVLERMGFLVIKHYVETSDLNTTVRISAKYSNLINLEVNNICDSQVYVMFRNSNLLIIDDIRTDCNSKTEEKPRIMVSEDMFKNNAIRNVLDSSNFEIRDKVLVCLPRNVPKHPDLSKKLSEEFRHMNLVLENDCNNITISDFVIAVLADAPFRSETKIPVIFYHAPHVVAEYMDGFPRSTYLWREWKPLKYAFKYLMDTMVWRRVAILSDDSDYSLDFLDDLLPLFDMEQYIYTSETCNGKSCNFSEPLQKLEEAGAMIVIINVDTIRAEKLVQQVSYYNLRHVTWIVRDWPFPRNIKNMTQMFSITLSPKFTKTDETQVYVSSIKKGLSLIQNTYTSVLGDIEKFQRKITYQYPKDFEIYAYVSRRDAGRHTVAAAMRIDGSRVHPEYSKLQKYLSNERKSDIPDWCLIRSNSSNYFKPCGNEEIIWILSVVIMFTFTLLVIIIFFTSYEDNPYDRIF